MSRTLTSGMLGVTTADVVRPAYFVRMVFDSSVLNIWSGIGDLAFGGNTYTGTGDLLSISEITETADIQATGIKVSLTGIKTSFIAIAKDQDYQGRVLNVSLGAFDASGSLIADPVIVFSGFMDTMTISESGQYSTITVSVENKLISFERSKVRRYTAEDQKIDHPTDKGFEFVTAIVQKQIIWGRATPTGGGDFDDGGGTTPGFHK
jgi:hypothetical protein